MTRSGRRRRKEERVLSTWRRRRKEERVLSTWRRRRKEERALSTSLRLPRVAPTSRFSDIHRARALSPKPIIYIIYIYQILYISDYNIYIRFCISAGALPASTGPVL